jgi:hypothetical protein
MFVFYDLLCPKLLLLPIFLLSEYLSGSFGPSSKLPYKCRMIRCDAEGGDLEDLVRINGYYLIVPVKIAIWLAPQDSIELAVHNEPKLAGKVQIQADIVTDLSQLLSPICPIPYASWWYIRSSEPFFKDRYIQLQRHDRQWLTVKSFWQAQRTGRWGRAASEVKWGIRRWRSRDCVDGRRDEREEPESIGMRCLQGVSSFLFGGCWRCLWSPEMGHEMFASL